MIKMLSSNPVSSTSHTETIRAKP